MNKKHAAKLATAIAKVILVRQDAIARGDGASISQASEALYLLDRIAGPINTKAASLDAAEATINNGG